MAPLGAGMLRTLTDHISFCLDQAAEAKRWAKVAAPESREEFVKLEQRWLSLAASYESSHRAEIYLLETQRKLLK
jgi:hypothetical protein